METFRRAPFWCDSPLIQGEPPTNLLWGTIETDLGAITVCGTPQHLVYLGFDETRSLQQVQKTYPSAQLTQDPAWAKSCVTAVWNIWQTPTPPPAQRVNTQISLAVHGTAFQYAVWDALMRIPKGHVVTYGTVAAAIGHPNAVRAVGSAVGANPVSLLIPCHRVVPKAASATKEATEKTIGNYMWGPEIKRALLRAEGALP